MTDTACETCRFWQALIPDGEGWPSDRNYQFNDLGCGICRRYPPVGQRRDAPDDPSSGEMPYALDAVLWAQWPVTDGEGDWCGEHSPRDRDGR